MRFGIFLLLVYGSNIGALGQGSTHARAHTNSCGAMAPPSGQHSPLLGRAVRAREEGSELVSGAGPGQESARAALLREVNALPRLYFPFCSSRFPIFSFGFLSC